MKSQQSSMRPQDVVILLKISTYGDLSWYQKPLAEELGMSQSEVSESIARSKYARLLDHTGKKIRKMALLELLQFGVPYMFPQEPGAIVRGFATAHSAEPLHRDIQSEEQYVWPSGKGNMKGQAIIPLYPSIVNAIQNDSKLHSLLALVDVLRVGRAREKELAVSYLKKLID